MTRIIEISEKKREKMSEHVEDALYAMGKVMSCLEELDGEIGERGSRSGHSRNMGGRDRYGNRQDHRYEYYGDKDDWDDDDMDDEPMGERRYRSRRMRR